MSQIKHIGKHFILGRQGRESNVTISEAQLWECFLILLEEARQDGGDMKDVLESLEDEYNRKE